MAISHGLSYGYGVVINTDRILGSKTTPWRDYCSTYLGPYSHASDEERAKALNIAAELTEKKEFELSKDSILKVLYRAPGLFSRGHVIFQTASEKIELKIGDLQNGGVPRTLKGLIPSLIAFAEDRFYDEKTGVLVGTEVIKTGNFPK